MLVSVIKLVHVCVALVALFFAQRIYFLRQHLKDQLGAYKLAPSEFWAYSCYYIHGSCHVGLFLTISIYITVLINVAKNRGVCWDLVVF